MERPSCKPPVLGLVVSGGHTLLLRLDSPGDFALLGGTIDDAAGEAFDKVAKILGLGYPGGPEIDRVSRGQDPDRFTFKRPNLSSDSLDFSFSGIKTAVLYAVEALRKKKALTAAAKKQLAAGFQEAVCRALADACVRAVRRTALRTVVVGGGVSANTRLRALLQEAARREGFEAVFPGAALCQDNAAMIAGLGLALYRAGRRDGLNIEAYPDFLQHHGLRRATIAERRRAKHETRRRIPASHGN